MRENAQVGPTDDELFEFARSTLQSLGDEFRSDEALHETLTFHRELWLTLYRASSNADVPEGRAAG